MRGAVERKRGGTKCREKAPRLFSLAALLGATLFLTYAFFQSPPRAARHSIPKGKHMIFETIVVGQLGGNCYILGSPDTGEGIVVDPGAEPERIAAAVERLGLRVKYILNTHGHFDHVGGNRRLIERSGAKLLIHERDLPFLSRASAAAASYGLTADDSPPPDQFLADGMRVTFGSCGLTVLHTPGHTPGGCSLYLEGEGIVLTGDTLFADSVGRTDFPGSSHEALIEGIRTKLLTLPEETRVFPGHGPSTTIGREKRLNPYLAEK